MMDKIATALQDMKSDIASGITLETAAEQSAKEYGLNPVLLVRKFIESFGSPEALEAFNKAMADGSATLWNSHRAKSAEVDMNKWRHQKTEGTYSVTANEGKLVFKFLKPKVRKARKYGKSNPFR